MSIASKIKGWFKKEEPKVQEIPSSVCPTSPDETLANSPKTATFNIQLGRRSVDKPCAICGNIIGEDKWTKKGGKHFHKSCYKQKYKEVMNNSNGT